MKRRDHFGACKVSIEIQSAAVIGVYVLVKLSIIFQ